MQVQYFTCKLSWTRSASLLAKADSKMLVCSRSALWDWFNPASFPFSCSSSSANFLLASSNFLILFLKQRDSWSCKKKKNLIKSRSPVISVNVNTTHTWHHCKSENTSKKCMWTLTEIKIQTKLKFQTNTKIFYFTSSSSSRTFSWYSSSSVDVRLITSCSSFSSIVLLFVTASSSVCRALIFSCIKDKALINFKQFQINNNSGHQGFIHDIFKLEVSQYKFFSNRLRIRVLQFEYSLI